MEEDTKAIELLDMLTKLSDRCIIDNMDIVIADDDGKYIYPYTICIKENDGCDGKPLAVFLEW